MPLQPYVLVRNLSPTTRSRHNLSPPALFPTAQLGALDARLDPLGQKKNYGFGSQDRPGKHISSGPGFLL